MKDPETRPVDEQHDSYNCQEAPQEQEMATRPGVIAALGELPAGAILYEQGLAALFSRHPTSIKRAVQRGELPSPVRMFGTNAWTAGALVQHIEERLEEAARAQEQFKKKVRQLSP